jgi:hypothetical protein
MRLAIITACAVGLSLALVSGQAHAQPGGAARARVHFETGTRAFEEGDYALAIREFQAAYAITEHPDLLFNIYSAAERAGQLEDAEGALARYLEVGRVPRRQRRALEARLARLRLRIEEVRAQAPPEPPPEPAPPEPVAPVAPPAAEPEAPAPAPRSSGGVHPAGVATLIVAGGLLASFGVFAALSEGEDQSLASSCGRDRGATCPPSDVQRLEAFNVIADVSWIAGATAAVVGLVLVFALPPEASAPSVAFAPWATPDGAGAGVVGQW